MYNMQSILWVIERLKIIRKQSILNENLKSDRENDVTDVKSYLLRKSLHLSFSTQKLWLLPENYISSREIFILK